MSLDSRYTRDNPDMRRTIDAATPGPWTLGGLKVYQGSGHSSRPLLRLEDGGNPADLAFAACARQDIDKLEAKLVTTEHALKLSAEWARSAERTIAALDRERDHWELECYRAQIMADPGCYWVRPETIKQWEEAALS